MSKYYKERYCVVGGVHPHTHCRSFDNFEEAWKYFTEWKAAGGVNVELIDSSERSLSIQQRTNTERTRNKSV